MIQKRIIPLLCLSLAAASPKYTFAGNALLPLSANRTEAVQQQKQQILKGKVTNKKGEPLPGVTIQVKGKTQGTITDITGMYHLHVKAGDELVFSFVGMKTQTIKYKGNGELNIVMQDDEYALNDVVVIGYGSKNRKSLTSAISSVKSAEIERMAPVSSNIQDLIGGGVLKGVLATQNTGEPGSSISINVRGITSPYPNMQSGINNNAPLYVIDGVPLFVESTNINPLMNLSPNDIESIDVLKDASATAIYGSRGANGVIIVTTRNGQKERRPTVEIGYTLMVSNPVKTFVPLNTDEFTQYTSQNLRNSIDAMNQGIGFSSISQSISMIDFDPDTYMMVYNGIADGFIGTANTDWQKEISNPNALSHQYSASVRGGGQLADYSISLNGTNKDGLYKADKFENYGGRMAINAQLRPNFKIGAVMNYSQTQRRSSSDGLGTASGETKPWLVRPDVPVYDENGDFARIDQGLSYGVANMVMGPSPVALLQRQTKYGSNQFLGNLFAEYELFKGLKFRTDFSMTNYTFDSDYYTPLEATLDARTFGTPFESELSTSNSKYTTTSLNFRFDYSYYHRNHLIGAMLGYGTERNTNAARSLSYSGFPNLNNIDAAREVISRHETSSKSGLNSVYGRVNYTYADRYLAELSMRADGSSKFGPGNRWGYFPAISLGWVISEESFIKNKEQINNLKMRLSLGQTGSVNVPDFVYQQYYNNGNLYGDQNTSVLNDNLPNANIGWEKTTELNFGLDFNLFRNRIYGSVDLYHRYTKGALAPAPHILESGMKNYWSNIIDVSNRGIEVSIGGDPIRTKDWTWSTNLNISHNNNRIENLHNAYIDQYLQDNFIVGYPLGATKGYVVDHILQNSDEINALNAKAEELNGAGSVYMNSVGPGDYLMKDLNGDGIITSAYDRTVIANPEPDLFGGWQNQISYRNWSLSCLLQFTLGGQAIYNNMMMEAMGSVGTGIGRELYNNFWTPDNTNARYARIGDGIYNYNTATSDRYVFDTSYMRLKNITLNYQLPNKWLKKSGISSLSIYAVATNLLTFTKWPGIDPESVGTGNLAGVNYDSYPLAKSISLGLKLQF